MCVFFFHCYCIKMYFMRLYKSRCKNSDLSWGRGPEGLVLGDGSGPICSGRWSQRCPLCFGFYARLISQCLSADSGFRLVGCYRQSTLKRKRPKVLWYFRSNAHHQLIKLMFLVTDFTACSKGSEINSGCNQLWQEAASPATALFSGPHIQHVPWFRVL